jgi:hypothetical protein
MALIVDVRVNDKHLGVITAVRMDQGGGEDPDNINTYQVGKADKEGSRTLGQVDHRYGDGPFVLAAKITAFAAERERNDGVD